MPRSLDRTKRQTISALASPRLRQARRVKTLCSQPRLTPSISFSAASTALTDAPATSHRRRRRPTGWGRSPAGDPALEVLLGAIEAAPVVLEGLDVGVARSALIVVSRDRPHLQPVGHENVGDRLVQVARHLEEPTHLLEAEPSSSASAPAIRSAASCRRRARDRSCASAPARDALRMLWRAAPCRCRGAPLGQHGTVDAVLALVRSIVVSTQDRRPRPRAHRRSRRSSRRARHRTSRSDCGTTPRCRRSTRGTARRRARARG